MGQCDWRIRGGLSDGTKGTRVTSTAKENNAISSIDTTIETVIENAMRSDQIKPKKLAAKSSHAKNFNEKSSIDMTIEAVIQSAMTPDQKNKQIANIKKNQKGKHKRKSKKVQVKTEEIQRDLDKMIINSGIKKENDIHMEEQE